jgi:hypothetical protein
MVVAEADADLEYVFLDLRRRGAGQRGEQRCGQAK